MGAENFLFSTASKPEPIQPPIQWASSALLPRVREPACEADHYLVLRLRMSGTILNPPPICPNGVALNSLGKKTTFLSQCVTPEKMAIFIFSAMLGQCISKKV
jgi:hypothetical protein